MRSTKTSEQPKHDDKSANTAASATNNAVDMKTPSILQDLDLCCPSDKQPFASKPKGRNAVKNIETGEICSYDTTNNWHFIRLQTWVEDHKDMPDPPPRPKPVSIKTNIELKNPPTKKSLDEELKEKKVFVACPAIDKEADRWTQLARMPAQIEEKLSDEDKKTIAKAREQFLPDTTPVNIIEEGFFSSAIKLMSHPMFPALLLAGFFVAGFIFFGIVWLKYLRSINIPLYRDSLNSHNSTSLGSHNSTALFTETNEDTMPYAVRFNLLSSIQLRVMQVINTQSHIGLLLSLSGRAIHALSSTAKSLSFSAVTVSSFIQSVIKPAQSTKNSKRDPYGCADALYECRQHPQNSFNKLLLESQKKETNTPEVQSIMNYYHGDTCIQDKDMFESFFSNFEFAHLRLWQLPAEEHREYCEQNLKECSQDSKKHDNYLGLFDHKRKNFWLNQRKNCHDDLNNLLGKYDALIIRNNKVKNNPVR